MKLYNFQNVCGTIKRKLRGRARTETFLKLHKVMTVSALLYESECWTLNKQQASRTETVKMRFIKAEQENRPN
jgi:hypothetical protein